MSTVKSKNLQVGTDATASNNFTIYQPSTPDGTLRIGVGNADSPTEVGRFNNSGYVPAKAPAFSAYGSALVTASQNTFTKVTYTTEDFDTNNNFSSSRFTPTVSGYYNIQAHVYVAFNNSGGAFSSIFKNGSRYCDGTTVSSTNGNDIIMQVSAVIYLNGSTDYIEIYGYHGITGSTGLGSNNYLRKFCGNLVQQA